jgi:hypothetical protein
MRTHFAAVVLAVLGTVSPSPAQSTGNCPDQRASPVPGAQQDIGPYRHCLLMIEVLGVPIAISTGRCPTGRTSVAPHEECLGLYSPGHDCEISGSTPVNLSLCRCVPHTWHGGSFTRCECKSVGAVGFIPTGHTFACP